MRNRGRSRLLLVTWRIPTLIKTETILLAIFLVSSSSSAATSDSLAPGQSINASQTLVSAGRTITLGFFSPAESNRLYLGIWYTNVPNRRVVWVANREAPVKGANATLSLSLDGKLLISDGLTVVWSTNTAQLSRPMARLTDNGNFVVFNGTRNGTGGVAAWQSFQHPTDTMLPDMTIGVNFRTGINVNLSSWRSSDDPAPGDYTLAIDTQGVPQLVLYYKSKPKWRMGPWTGKYWSGTPSITQLTTLTFSFNQTEDEVSYAFHVGRRHVFSSLMVNHSSGQVVRWLWIPTVPYEKYWPAPTEKCSNYKQCGTFSVCNGDDQVKFDCSCLEGFVPNNPSNVGDCVRETSLDCRNGTDVFARRAGIKLPDTSVAVADHGLGMEECKMACMKNCSCTAYASADSNGSGCLMWFDDLFDIKTQADKPQDVYIRIGSKKLEKKPRNNKKVTVVVVVVVCAVLGALLSGCVCCFMWRKKKNIRGSFGGGSDTEDIDLPILDFATVAAATHNFSDENKLGQGGFGPVYKGTLADGQEVAVKRLSNCSPQGIREFKNEVQLIAKLQHRNLVKLLSCCIHGDERLLIYEYMPNKSLDYFLFEKSKDESLDWETRYKIIVGTARGILYLHQDSRLRIIHRDLKAGNVLLDAEMNPKISDFGTARIFGGNDSDFTNTIRVVGTYGYMSPEYALDGIFSTKSDVFSFGVLVLEVVSGVKNRAVFQSDPRHNLIGHAWTLWTEENIYRLIDESLVNQQTSSFKKSQVFKCIQIGLLCVQEQPDDRPSMSSVMHMLAGDDQSLPEPKQPGFVTLSAPTETNTMTSKDQGFSSTNDMSITMVEGR